MIALLRPIRDHDPNDALTRISATVLIQLKVCGVLSLSPFFPSPPVLAFSTAFDEHGIPDNRVDNAEDNMI